ncbi:sugar transferase [Lacinutrix sp. MedPE-SW]|uniref:sugar transferase n=1 Tax=Lacinutrix sp. MedPE-SW TaxID=1860087 RepID=UPI00091869E1|nr:sugar transferase [Lacinutrix sp. MedPE-SW]OIQ22704.1 MAG: sugar transferase [Lacinutrix sp. MedPE-SW]
MAKKNIHFEISERKVLLRIFDLISVGVALYGFNYFTDFDYFKIDEYNWHWLILLIIYIIGFGTIFELYDLKKSSRIESITSSILLTTSTTVLVYLLTPFFTPTLPENRIQILYFFLAILLPLLIWRFAYITLISSPRFYKRALLVGEISNIESIVGAFKNVDPNYQIIGFINCEISQEDNIKYKGIKEFDASNIYDVLAKEHISEIVIASNNSETIAPSIYVDLITLLERGFPIKEYTQVYEDMSYRVPVQFVGKDFYKYFPFSRNNKNKLYLTYRRIFDLVLSFIGLCFSVLILPILLIGNLIGNRGPLFYIQERIGKNGKPFKIYKFRSMIINAEKDGAVWAKKNDTRITTFGRFLRTSRIDELPQLINIIKGDMSIIGPRPERPVFVNELSQVIPFYNTRHIVKPGLTGWAQVKSRYGSSIDDSMEKLQYDLFYIKHRSFLMDFNIIIKTLSTVIFFRGQ